MAATFRIDDRQTQAFMRRYTPREIDKVLQLAAAAGARAGAKVERAHAPIGKSKRESQFYRRQHAGHGEFARSVKATKVRQRGIQARTIAYVVGPQGKFGFTRAWIEGGTKPHKGHPGQAANPWFERGLPAALKAAETATRTVIDKYGTAVK